MNNFNKLYEDIFKPASPEEVKTRQEQGKLEEFKEWVEDNLHIKYEDLFNKENINKQDEYGSTALIWAITNNNIKLVKLLIDNGADVNAKSKYGSTALVWASIHDNIKIVKLLLDNGADPNIKDEEGDTALILASDNKKIVKLLKQYGAE